MIKNGMEKDIIIMGILHLKLKMGKEK